MFISVYILCMYESNDIYKKKVTTFEINHVLLDFSLTVKAATLIFISWRGSAISSATEVKSGFTYNLVRR